MSFIGSWKIDDVLTFVVNTQVFATGVATDADGAPAYRVYEDETTTPLLTGTMALLDSSNTAGFYSEQITLSAANGFEKGKCYSIYISATVSSVAGATHRSFQIEAPVDVRSFGGSALTQSGGRPEVNTTHWGGTAVASANVLIDGAITAAKIASNAIAAAKIEDGALTAAKFASGAFDAVWSVATRLLTAGTNIVLAKGTGVTGFNDLSAAQVNTEADTALADAGVTTTRTGYLDNLSAGAVATAAKLLSYFQSALRKDVTVDADIGGNYDDATDSQEAIRDRGDAAWITATGFSTHSAADVWAVGTRTLTSFGTLVADVATAVWGAATRLLTAGTNIVLAKGTGVTGFNDPTAVENADALLDRNMATGTDSGSSTVRTVRQALRMNRNKFTISGSTLTVMKEDDSTTSHTATVTQTAGDPISAVDPAGP